MNQVPTVTFGQNKTQQKFQTIDRLNIDSTFNYASRNDLKQQLVYHQCTNNVVGRQTLSSVQQTAHVVFGRVRGNSGSGKLEIQLLNSLDFNFPVVFFVDLW